MTHCRDCKFYSIKIVDLRSFLCIRLCSVEPKDPNHPNAKFKRVLKNTEDGCEKFEPRGEPREREAVREQNQTTA